MTHSPTPTELLALKTANAALLESNDSFCDMVATVVFALGSAQLLQSPETAAELAALRARVAELEAERHTTNEALSDAAEALRASRDSLFELPLFLAEFDSVEPELHLTPDAARAVCDDIAKAVADGQSWDWLRNEDGVWVQFWTHEDDDRPTGFTGGQVTELRVQRPSPTRGELAKQRHLVDPLDHVLEALAPRTTATIETAGSTL
ncbi:hypothetical protein [Streptomyces sp. NPDC013457]|uniref:hypothetical protein n=1 Tax=Streptomyces sp. NPDC013457 TaxID=3364866 RepID=UPI0036FCD2BD